MKMPSFYFPDICLLVSISSLGLVFLKNPPAFGTIIIEDYSGKTLQSPNISSRAAEING